MKELDAAEARRLADDYKPPGAALVAGREMKLLEQEIARVAEIGWTSIDYPPYRFPPEYRRWARTVLEQKGYRVSRGFFGNMVVRW